MSLYDRLRVDKAEAELDAMFGRLLRLHGGDAGFYVLAVHSFMESLLREFELPTTAGAITFTDFIFGLKQHLLGASKGSWVRGLDFIGQANQQHHLTNDVRHRFGPAATEDALVATSILRAFCAATGIPERAGLTRLCASLGVWNERRSTVDLAAALSRAEAELKRTKSDAVQMAAKVAEYEKIQTTLSKLEEDLRRRDRELQELRATGAHQKERIDSLRKERADLAGQLGRAHQDANALSEAREYLATLARLSLQSRTRADYERSILRLSPEQAEALAGIRLDHDVLIKGAAGTGKTLVLLKAIEKLKGDGTQPQFDLENPAPTATLLTFTSTLVKYDRYMASIMSAGLGADSIATADSFIFARLRALVPDAEIEYGVAEKLAAGFPVPGLSDRELAAELESFIWSRDLSEEDYVAGMIERRGMKKPLRIAERQSVWASCRAIEACMEEKHRYTKNYARVKILRALASGWIEQDFQAPDYIFLDEVQDLAACDLKLLKRLSRRALIMAGDSDQSIYQPGFSFRSAGIEISGMTRILKMNFRNTIPLHALAESYRSHFPDRDGETLPCAFREGPQPELFTAVDRDKLLDSIAARISLLTGRLGYDPENICVLAPLAKDVELVMQHLHGAGIEARDIKEREFEFSQSGAVRISTLHSAKGLDFPVILLFLYRKPYTGGDFDEKLQGIMVRNLIYVAITRAMDQLGVFCLEHPAAPEIADLVACFEP